MAIGSVVPDGRCNYVVYDENGNYTIPQAVQNTYSQYKNIRI